MAEVKLIHEQDFFKRIIDLVIAKQKITFEHLQETQLLMNVLANPPVAVKREIEELYAKHLETYGNPELQEMIYMKSLLDCNQLRDDVDPDHVMNITMYTLGELTNKYLTLYKDKQFDFLENPEPMLKEFDSYIEIIKRGAYKL